jgi:anti-anti-sigma factor
MPPSGYRHIRSRSEQGVLVLSLLDREVTWEDRCADLRDELLDAFGSAGALKVVVDFAAVQYLSSVAFRPLLSLRRKVHDAGAHMVLCNLQPVPNEALQATRLISANPSAVVAFETKADLPAAVAYLNSLP